MGRPRKWYSLLTHLFGKWAFHAHHITLQKCGGALTCWKNMGIARGTVNWLTSLRARTGTTCDVIFIDDKGRDCRLLSASLQKPQHPNHKNVTLYVPCSINYNTWLCKLVLSPQPAFKHDMSKPYITEMCKWDY
jgi:hypothetical protein